MEFENSKIKKLYKYLSSMSCKAYSDPRLISNDILCKQDSHGLILEAYLSGKIPKKVTFPFAVKKILLYFSKNLVAFLLYLVTAIAHRLSKQVFHFPKKDGLLIVDTYFVARMIIERGQFVDIFFTGLEDALTRKKNNYVYVPRLVGTMNALKWFGVFRILKKNHEPVLIEFQLLEFSDYLKIIQFIFLYPFSVFRFTKTLGATEEDRILCNGLWQRFDNVAFHGYVRFLLGRRLSFLKNDRIKCLSWYENQTLDKNFYRGLRSTSRRIDIIGAQLFVRPHGYLNIITDELESSFDVIPGRILVNGQGYSFVSEYAQVEVGPSLRNGHLFGANINPSEGDNILVLMPAWEKVVRYILEVIDKVDWPIPVEIKFHPSADRKLYEHSLSKRFSVTEKSLPDLFMKAKMVVGRGSGSQLEAAALGIPVFDLLNPDEFSHCCMPEMGRGVLWDQAINADDVARIVSQFQKTLRVDPSRLREEGARIRSCYFSEPTDELIEKMLGLDKMKV
jgi:hypothetical protein